MKKILIIIISVAIVIIAGLLILRNNYTFTLSGSENRLKSEQIQPITGTVRVYGTCDTDVVFTDVETGKEYTIGYITNGMSESIKLKTGKWYTVECDGTVTVKPVNVRVE